MPRMPEPKYMAGGIKEFCYPSTGAWIEDGSSADRNDPISIQQLEAV